MSHIPVLLDDVLALLAPRDGGIYLDATFGGGGHASAILAAAHCTLFAIDRDPAAIARGAALAARYPGRLTLIEGRFSAMLELLGRAGVDRLDGIVMDLGVSSFQLDDPARGFSFRFAGPLDMRMGRDGPTAAELVNTLPAEALASLLAEFGEERHARRIARHLLAARARRPIATTTELAEIIRAAMPPSRERIDPATRSFQALRIRVNDELGEIASALEQAASLLAPGGRLIVIAFHSLEDRLVKRFMAAAAGRTPLPSRHLPASPREAARFRLLTPRAVRPSAAEIAANARAASARLRAIERVGGAR
ncbi:MAG TPA: 16S rRNA (cytosine(1402)-N(4))-methyltransferase RsmH [Acetobacteraceae bacterium]|jgi:16S rRNA (cytosine1402-N4)-methyltransferase|nr:16S rRNA (cytosine(1402)-N(4))-methyltransferase RsmH [Acetobacteraceae bacterium]